MNLTSDRTKNIMEGSSGRAFLLLSHEIVFYTSATFFFFILLKLYYHDPRSERERG